MRRGQSPLVDRLIEADPNLASDDQDVERAALIALALPFLREIAERAWTEGASRAARAVNHTTIAAIVYEETEQDRERKQIADLVSNALMPHADRLRNSKDRKQIEEAADLGWIRFRLADHRLTGSASAKRAVAQSVARLVEKLEAKIGTSGYPAAQWNAHAEIMRVHEVVRG